MDITEVLFGEVFFRCESVLHPSEGLTQVALIRFFPFRNFVNPIVSREGLWVHLHHSHLVLWSYRGHLHPFSQQFSSLPLPEKPVWCVGWRDWSFLMVHERAVFIDSLPLSGFVDYFKYGCLVPPFVSSSNSWPSSEMSPFPFRGMCSLLHFFSPFLYAGWVWLGSVGFDSFQVYSCSFLIRPISDLMSVYSLRGDPRYVSLWSVRLFLSIPPSSGVWWLWLWGYLCLPTSPGWVLFLPLLSTCLWPVEWSLCPWDTISSRGLDVSLGIPKERPVLDGWSSNRPTVGHFLFSTHFVWLSSSVVLQTCRCKWLPSYPL